MDRENIWVMLCKHWRSEEHKKISERAKKNRASEKGGALHCGGSINTAQHLERMERALGRPVPLHELHRHMHTQKDTGDYVDERSRRIQEEFEDQMNQYQSQTRANSSTHSPIEEIRVSLSKWVDVVGGKKKGRVYGTGSLAPCYKKGAYCLDTNASCSSAASTACSPIDDPTFMEMQQTLATALREAQETKRAHEELLSKFNQMQEQQRKMFEWMQQQAMPPPSHLPYYFGPSTSKQYYMPPLHMPREP